MAASKSKLQLVTLDDDPLNAELLARAARKWGYEAQSIVDPKTLPSLMQKVHPNVVTLDLRMNGTTGSDVLMMLKACDYRGEIIIISGLDLTVLDTVRRQAQTMGLKVAGTMRKPVNLKALHDILTNLTIETGQNDILLKRIESVISNDEISPVFQPIYNLTSGSIRGVEMLSRFRGRPERAPDKWMAEAEEAGMAVELETYAAVKGLAGLSYLPGNAYLALNLSPNSVMQGALKSIVSSANAQRLVLELTEHASVPSYDGLIEVLKPYRSIGLRIAIDDAGSGFSSFRHILTLKPNIIKIDQSIVRDIDHDNDKQALTTAFIDFSRQTDVALIAEGVETPSELATLRGLGIENVQGYLLGRPIPLEDMYVKLAAKPELANSVSPVSQ